MVVSASVSVKSFQALSSNSTITYKQRTTAGRLPRLTRQGWDGSCRRRSSLISLIHSLILDTFPFPFHLEGCGESIVTPSLNWVTEANDLKLEEWKGSPILSALLLSVRIQTNREREREGKVFMSGGWFSLDQLTLLYIMIVLLSSWDVSFIKIL